MSISMRDFLQKMKHDFHKRGTVYMVPMVEEMLQMDINSEADLQELVVVCKEERDRHTAYNLKFMYYWSVLTYITDMAAQFRIQNEPQKESSK